MVNQVVGSRGRRGGKSRSSGKGKTKAAAHQNDKPKSKGVQQNLDDYYFTEEGAPIKTIQPGDVLRLLRKLKKQCKACSELLNLAWNVCPYCEHVQRPQVQQSGHYERSEGELPQITRQPISSKTVFDDDLP